VRYREELRAQHPDWWNAPVPVFGDPVAWLAIVGLAPGRMGANRTGQPFTGDASGEIFYSTLLKFGLAEGAYTGEADGGIKLKGAVVLNTVKCLPPANRPTPEEVRNCSAYLEAALANLPRVNVLIALGQIAHTAVARVIGFKAKFAHGAEMVAPGGCVLLTSYHCSRQNTNTGKLTREMFESVFARATALGG
jgi:uracil-DNA glycosylase family 4